VAVLFYNAVPQSHLKRSAAQPALTMNREGESSAVQMQVDNDICRLRAEQPHLSFMDMANVINARHSTSFTPSMIAAQW
jgi:hypothetical protein